MGSTPRRPERQARRTDRSHRVVLSVADDDGARRRVDGVVLGCLDTPIVWPGVDRGGYHRHHRRSEGST